MGKKFAVAAAVILLASGSWWLLRVKAELHDAASMTQTVSSPVETEHPQHSAETGQLATTNVEGSSRSSASTVTDAFGALYTTWIWSDGTPAAELGVDLVHLSSDSPSRYVRTDAAGHCSFEQLPEGDLVLLTDRGRSSPSFPCSARPGVRTSMTFTVPAGVTVRGRVLDPEGRPVAKASLWTANTEDEDARPVGTSGGDGSYMLRDLRAGCGLFATADSFGASHLEQLRERSVDASGTILLDLTLRGAGGTVRGVVRDPEGEPVEGAWVTVRCEPSITPDGIDSWPRPWTATDTEGGYSIEGLRVGTAEVFVDSRTTFAPWSGPVEIEEGRAAILDVRLESGFVLEGSVKRADGTPSAGAYIRLEPSDSSRRFDPLKFHSTTSDTNGRFRLDRIPSGSVEVVAEAKDRRGHAAASLKGRAGELVRWDAILKEDLVIRGRLIDETSRPIEGWTLEAVPRVALETFPSNPQTAADGRFEIVGCSDVPFTVAAYPPREPGVRSRGIPAATATGVRPGGSELILTVTRSTRPSAFVTGRIVDDQGQPLRGARARAESWETRFGVSAPIDEGEGTFRLGPLSAGKWPVTVYPRNLPGFSLGTFDLEPEEVRDLGTIAVASLGGLELELRREDGALLTKPWITLWDRKFCHILKSPDGSTFRGNNLYAGTYTLVPIGENVATLTRTVEIRGGETTKLDLALPSGVVQWFTFPTAGGEPAPEKLRVVARTLDGAIVIDAASTFNISPEGTWIPNFRAGFAPGSYVLEATSEDGWFARVDLRFGEASAQPGELVVPLTRSP